MAHAREPRAASVAEAGIVLGASVPAAVAVRDRGLRVVPQSGLKASTSSICVARRAGMRHAKKPASPNVRMMAA